MYEDRFKYPRTYHFDWSLSLKNDDRKIPNEWMEAFVGKEIVVTEKYDGENTSMYHDISHARSMDSRHHPSRDWAKMFHGQIKHRFRDAAALILGDEERYADLRVVVESNYARHSIAYTREKGNALPSFCMGLSVWDRDGALSWDDSLMVFDLMGILPARVLYRGVWDEKLLREMALDQDPDLIEGYVVRVVDRIPFGHWFLPAGKYVRAKHVNTSQHWMRAEIVPNEEMLPEELELVRQKLVAGQPW